MKTILLACFIFLNVQAHEKPKQLTKKIINYEKKDFKFNYLDYCDACGCSANGGSMGFGSVVSANFFGVRYINQNYETNDGLYTNSHWLKEKFNTYQLWSKIPINKKIQLSTLIPYHAHRKEVATGQNSIKGLGDITVMGFYTLWNKKKDSIGLSQTIQVGAGLKMPTGTFDETTAGTVNPSFQLGTGSWDYLFSTEYVIKKHGFGWSNLLNYVVKSSNANAYRFGNQLNYNSTCYYLFEKDKMIIAPQIGLAGEVYASNYKHQEKIRNTSGDVLFTKFGAEIAYKEFSVGAFFQTPLYQHLMSDLVKAKSRLSISFNYKL